MLLFIRIDCTLSSSWQQGGIDASPRDTTAAAPRSSIIDLNPQTESVVLRVRERYIYRESNPFDDLVTRGINRGYMIRYMLYDVRDLFYTSYLW